MNIVCSECSSQLPPNVKFCTKCGESVDNKKVESNPENTSTNCVCGNMVSPMAKFCTVCGMKMNRAETKPEPETRDLHVKCQCGEILTDEIVFCPSCGTGRHKEVLKPEPSVQLSPKPKICECGQTLEPEHRFCTGCGKPAVANEEPKQHQHPVENASAIIENTVSAAHSETQADRQNISVPVAKSTGITSRKKKRKRKNFTSASIIFLFMIGTILGAYYYKHGNINFLDFDLFGGGTTKMKADLSTVSAPPDNFIPVYDKRHSFGTQKHILNADNPVFSNSGVSLALDPYFVSSDVELTVRPFKMKGSWKGVTANPYEFKLDNGDKDVGMIEIRIPYTKKSEEDMVGAGYYNELTGEWEPVVFTDDKQNNEIVVLTDHLSIYSSFVMQGEGTRGAQVARLSNYFYTTFPSKLDNLYHQVIVESSKIGFVPGETALDLGLSAVSEWLGYAGNALTIQDLAYSTDFLSDFSDVLTNVGYVMAMIEVANACVKGETEKAGVIALTTAQSYGISKFSTTALQIGLIGVFFIDYSLNRFLETAMTGVEDKYTRAYNLYYSKQSPISGTHKDSRDWYRTLIQIIDKSKNPAQAKEEIMKTIDEYVYRFWNDKNNHLVFGDLNIGFGAWGGYNKELAKKISENKKSILLNGILKSVFERLEKEIQNRQKKLYFDERSKLAGYLNQVVDMTIKEEKFDGKAEYAGYYIRFSPLSENAVVRNWTGKLNKDGMITTRFTILGHLLAGAPSKLHLFKNRESLERNVPDLEVGFTIDLPHTTVILKPEGVEFEDIPGTYDITSTVDDIDMGIMGGLMVFSTNDGNLQGNELNSFMPAKGTVSKGKMDISITGVNKARVIVTYLEGGYDQRITYTGYWNDGVLRMEMETEGGMEQPWNLHFYGPVSNITCKGTAKGDYFGVMSYTGTFEGKKVK